ncbi:MAG TPA: tail fiber domain-containing protein [Candidatus Dormibacteraeota bacterium]|nr:tail fiber domain-containing protein [Candidatus Dormibacteraeota bacterium]
MGQARPASTPADNSTSTTGITSTTTTTTSTTSNFYSTVGGGFDNTANNIYATVAGGEKNAASGPGATVAGGQKNAATGPGASVGGGGFDGTTTAGNVASGKASTVPGGLNNSATLDYATVGGGSTNTAGAPGATVAGGQKNAAKGMNATVPGGQSNTAAGTNSLAAGSFANVQAVHNGAMLFSDDSNPNAFNSAAPGEFASRCTGGARFVSAVTESGAPSSGVSLAAGGGSWSSISDRNLKENFEALDGFDVLERLSHIPISEWNYKAQGAVIRHLGPMAQDFYEAFHIGEDDRHITTIDADGVALAAIQALYKVVRDENMELKNQVRDEIGTLREENAALRTRLEVLERHAMTLPVSSAS